MSKVSTQGYDFRDSSDEASRTFNLTNCRGESDELFITTVLRRLQEAPQSILLVALRAALAL